jgi:two-component system, NarL family, response regulator NreC
LDKIQVLLAEDHTIVRQGLRSILDGREGIQVVGEAQDGREAVEKAQQLQPDIVLMDLSMPLLSGLEATRQIKSQCPHIEVLVLTMHADEEYVFQILQAGASGYLLKQSAVGELVTAIQAVYEGDSYLSPAISRKLVDGYVRQAREQDKVDSYEQLTDREREVLHLIAEGRSTQEIADLLFISPKTVRGHRSSLTEKLGLHSNAELTRYAIRKGIVAP